MQRPLLVVSDVDGTLLNQYDQVSERNREAVLRVLASGTPFVLASGRPPRWIGSIAKAAGDLDGLAVCCNGSVCYDIGADRVLSVRQLDPVLLRDVVSAMTTSMPGITFAAERIGVNALDPDVVPFLAEPEYTHPWEGDVTHRASRAEVIGHPCVKLLARQPEMTSEEMAQVAQQSAGESVDVTFSTSLGLIELAPRGISKATALATISAELRVPAERTIAFGDMPNDVEMLRWAGHGVAMGNAHPSARAAADEVTRPSTEDGLAHVLERWF